MQMKRIAVRCVLRWGRCRDGPYGHSYRAHATAWGTYVAGHPVTDERGIIMQSLGPLTISPRASPLLRAAVLVMLAAVAVGVGVLAAAFGVPLIVGAVVLGGCAVILAHPVLASCALAAVSYAYAYPGVFYIEGLADIRLVNVAWLSVGAGLVARHVVAQRLHASGLPHSILVVAGLLVGWEAISALATGTPSGAVEVMQLAYLLGVAEAVALSASTLKDRGTARWVTFAALAYVGFMGAAFVALLFLSSGLPLVEASSGGIQLALHAPKTASGLPWGLPRFGLAGLGAVGAAAVCNVALALSVAYVLDPRRAPSVLAKAAALISVICLVLTLSRAGWLVGGVLVGALALRAGANRLAAAITFGVLVAVAAMSVPGVAARVGDLRNPEEISYRSHFAQWSTAVDMTMSRPLLGWGPRSFKAEAERRGLAAATYYLGYADAHNMVLQEAAEAGLPAAALLVTLVALALRRASIAARGHSLSVKGPYYALIGLVAMSMTMNAFRTEFFWCLLAVAIVMPRGLQPRGSPKSAGDGQSRTSS